MIERSPRSVLENQAVDDPQYFTHNKFKQSKASKTEKDPTSGQIVDHSSVKLVYFSSFRLFFVFFYFFSFSSIFFEGLEGNSTENKKLSTSAQSLEDCKVLSSGQLIVIRNHFSSQGL